MYLNVSQLLQEPSGAGRTIEIDDRVVLIEGKPATSITGVVALLRTDRGIWVSATLDSYLACDCSRCLEEYNQSVHLEVEEEFLPIYDVVTGKRLVHDTENSEDFYIDRSLVLNLTEAVRQYASLSLPMKTVCSTNCKGLCSTCGVDRNQALCNCDHDSIDPRWGPLLEISLTADRNN